MEIDTACLDRQSNLPGPTVDGPSGELEMLNACVVIEKMEARGSLRVQRLHPLLCSSGVSPWVIHPATPRIQRIVCMYFVPNLLRKICNEFMAAPLDVGTRKKGKFLGLGSSFHQPRRKVSFGQGRGIGRLPTSLLASTPPMHGFYVMWESRLDASDRGAWMGGQTHAS